MATVATRKQKNTKFETNENKKKTAEQCSRFMCIDKAPNEQKFVISTSMLHNRLRSSCQTSPFSYR